MNVQPINMSAPQHNSQPTFKGYVDKPVVKLIEGLTQMSMDKVVQKANLANEQVDVKKLQQIKAFGKSTLKKFELYMSFLHEKTILTFNKTRERLVIRNKELETEVNFTRNLDLSDETGKLDPIFERIDAYAPYMNSPDATLENFGNLANTLYTAPAKGDVDKFLFQEFIKKISKQAEKTSFFAGFTTKRNAKKADKLAPEFYHPFGWTEKLTQIREDAIQRKEEAKKLAKEQKLLGQANARKAKEILEK